MKTIEDLIKAKKESYKYFTEKESLEAVKQYGLALKYVHNQTEAICLEAVTERGCALQYVHNQTEAICLEAVRQDGYALMYVRNQTETIVLEAVKQNECALMYVHENLFIKEKEITIAELEEMVGFKIKIIK